MFNKLKMYKIQIIGVSFSEPELTPVLIFNNLFDGSYFSLPTDPFSAEILIRDYSGEGENSAAAWLSGILMEKSPNKACIKITGDGGLSVLIKFGRVLRTVQGRYLSLGEGLAVARRLSLPVFAEESVIYLYGNSQSFEKEGFSLKKDFLILSAESSYNGLFME